MACSLSEQDFFRHIGGGDEAVGRALHARALVLIRSEVQQLVRRYSVAGRVADAEACLAEACLKVYQDTARFDSGKATFPIFAVRVARRAVIEELRRQHVLPQPQNATRKPSRLPPAPVSFAEVLTDTLENPRVGEAMEDLVIEQMQEERRWEVIKELLAILPPRHLRVVRLHYFDGLPMAEVAKTLGVSCSSADRLRFGAVRLMKEKAARYGLVR